MARFFTPCRSHLILIYWTMTSFSSSLNESDLIFPLTLKSWLRGLRGINPAASTAVVIISIVDSSLLGREIRTCNNRNRHLVATHRHTAIAQHSDFSGEISCQTCCSHTQKTIDVAGSRGARFGGSRSAHY